MAKPCSALQKEAQATVAIVILDSIYSSNLTVTKKQVQEKLSTSFHGKGELASQKLMFLNGRGVYAKLFVHGSSANTSGSAGKPNAPDYALCIPPYLSRRADSLSKIGVAITSAGMGSSTLQERSLINGETLLAAAKEALKNCKKALAIASQYLDKKTGTPSGESLEDYLNHVLSEMHNLYGITSKKPGNLSGDGDGSNMKKYDPATDPRFFKGFWAFFLFGPFPKDNDALSILQLGDISEIYKNKMIAGRQYARKKARTESVSQSVSQAGETVSSAPPQSPFKKGMSFQDCIAATAVAQKRISDQSRNFEQEIRMLQSELDSLHRSVDEAFRFAQESDSREDKEQYLGEARALRAECAQVRINMRQLREGRSSAVPEEDVISNFVDLLPPSSRAGSYPNSVGNASYDTPMFKVPATVAVHPPAAPFIPSVRPPAVERRVQQKNSLSSDDEGSCSDQVLM